MKKVRDIAKRNFLNRNLEKYDSYEKKYKPNLKKEDKVS